jgi:hypothetical protein
MDTVSVDGITLLYDAAERPAAQIVGEACERTIPILRDHWGLQTPSNCRLYVMTSWVGFMFQTASWPRRIWLAFSFPLWALRARATWRYAGGWNVPYRQGPAVGVKPGRLLLKADRTVGDRIFIRAQDINQEVRRNTCHELTHAFTGHLRLPIWLHEGLAMVTVDMFVGRPTVQEQSLEALLRPVPDPSLDRSHGRPRQDVDSLVQHVVRGYWMTRYIEDTKPGLLRGLLSQPRSDTALESEIASSYGLERDEFWSHIDDMMAAHFPPLEQLH